MVQSNQSLKPLYRVATGAMSGMSEILIDQEIQLNIKEGVLCHVADQLNPFDYIKKEHIAKMTEPISGLCVIQYIDADRSFGVLLDDYLEEVTVN